MQREMQRLSWLKIKELVPSQIDTIILPVGTVEAHGSAAIGTDNFIPQRIAEGIAERTNALIAPIVNHGITKSLYRYAGSTTVSPEVFAAYIREIVDCFADDGFGNVIIMNGHGGNNSALKQVAYDFHRERRTNICVVHWWQLCADMTEKFFEHVGGHAGTDETAMVQAIDPDLVDWNAYSEDLCYQINPGADVYPVPGQILLYKAEQGYPENNPERSREYLNKVIEEVGDFVEMVLARWKKFDL
jgi:creatinine amidohydrolase